LALAALACGTDQGTGAVEVTAVSEGQDLDPNGYTVHLQGVAPQTIGANQTVAFAEVPAGDQEIHLSGVRGNCAVQQAHPRLIRVTEGETFRLQFEVRCARAPLLGRLLYSKVDPSVEREVNGDLYTMTADGSSQHRLTSTLLVEQYASIAPDGARILFQGAEWDLVDVRTDIDIYVMNADGTGLVALTHDQSIDDRWPTWSPDGSVIAFTRETRHSDGLSDSDIYLINPDGTSLVNITRTPELSERFPAWSPEGDRILFQAYTGTSSDLYVMNADGTRPTLLARDSISIGKGAWSPDGSRIVFEAFAPEREAYDLALINADGSGLTRLTDLPGSVDTPSWSPDGTRIVFQYFPPDYRYWGPVKTEVYAIHPDGTGLTNLSRTPDTNEFLGPNPWGP
jgi:Tol biopolymer transport system component